MQEGNNITSALDRVKKKQELEEQLKKETELYKVALNRVANTEDGIIVLKAILAYCGIFKDQKLNAQDLLEEKGKRSVYLASIRPYLKRQARILIEN